MNKQHVNEIHRSLMENLEKELGQIEQALKDRSMMKAEYHKLMAETYFDLME